MSFRMTVISAFAAAALIGCGGGGGSGAQTQEEDLAEFESLRAELEGKRKTFLEGPAQDFQAAGNLLFWVEAAAGDPRLHSFDQPASQTTDYSFPPFLVAPSSPNPIDNLNFVGSTSIIATMNVLDGAQVYSVGKNEEKLGKWTLPAPPYGQKWWSYGVDGGDVYAAILDDAGKLHLKKWTPNGAESDVAVFDDLIAPNAMGEFHNFAVSGTTLIFDEGGRIWTAELGAPKAKWAQNDKEVSGAAYDKAGVVYSQGGDFWQYDAATDSRKNLSEKIKGNEYKLNETFKEAHYPTSTTTWCKSGDKIVYEANYGIFAYDIGADTVEPLVLDARDNSIVYKYPTALDNGTLFVKGLESQSGATGADGPTFIVGQ
ncbi:MAG: hypothetical protein U0441_29135 [Polyangiaceae bacterium]